MKTFYYFCKVPKDSRYEGLTEDFNPKYYYRFRLSRDADIHLEDNCTRGVPIHLEGLREMRDTLDKIIAKLEKQSWL